MVRLSYLIRLFPFPFRVALLYILLHCQVSNRTVGLRGFHAFVTKQLLYGSNIHASINQQGGESMSGTMERDIPLYTDLFKDIFYPPVCFLI